MSVTKKNRNNCKTNALESSIIPSTLNVIEVYTHDCKNVQHWFKCDSRKKVLKILWSHLKASLYNTPGCKCGILCQPY